MATRCHLLRLICTKFDFGWGSAPDPARGAYSAPQTPSWISGANSEGEGGERRRGKRRWGEPRYKGEREEGKVEGGEACKGKGEGEVVRRRNFQLF